MRTIIVVVSSVLLAAATGCAAAPPPAPKAEPITYDRAAFTPPTEFDMSFREAQGPAVKRSEPTEGSYKTRLVSMEKPEQAAR